MPVTQLSVFLQNEKGRLARMCRVLGEGGFNMHALVVADTSEYGVVRVICDRPEGAREVLELDGFAVSATPVVAVRVPDVPGGLAEVLEHLGSMDVNVEYVYCFPRAAGDFAVDILRVEEAEQAIEALASAGFELVDDARLYEPDFVG